MTRLTKPIRRETVRTAVQGREIIVILQPGDLIAFRQKGCRKTYTTTIGACFWLAAKADAVEQAKIKKAERKARRQGL